MSGFDDDAQDTAESDSVDEPASVEAADGSSDELIDRPDVGFADLDPVPQYDEETIEVAASDLPKSDDEATAVLYIGRNLLNTINTQPTGYHWFSA